MKKSQIALQVRLSNDLRRMFNIGGRGALTEEEVQRIAVRVRRLGTACPVKASGHLAELLALQIRETQVQKENAIHDGPTGLFNAGYFDAELKKSVNAAKSQTINENYGRRSEDPTKRAVILIDLAGLKALNDGIAMHAGNAALKRLSTILQQEVRSEDYACRIGGDEFAVLMTDRQGQPNFPEAAVKRIKEALEERGYFEHQGKYYKLKFYIAHSPIDGNLDAKEVFQLIDDNISKAKAIAKHDRAKVDYTPVNPADIPEDVLIELQTGVRPQRSRDQQQAPSHAVLEKVL